MAATSYCSRAVAPLAGLLLLSFGSLATSQIEVGVRPSERSGPGRTAWSGPRAPSRCPIHRSRGKPPGVPRLLLGSLGCGRVSRGRAFSVSCSLLNRRIKRIKFWERGEDPILCARCARPAAERRAERSAFLLLNYRAPLGRGRVGAVFGVWLAGRSGLA